ncbi:MAG: FAD-binding oxidoreductase [Firmicutes bacterium]|nr:FAD-binding oxidoreductase [Bacillota bacterium]
MDAKILPFTSEYELHLMDESKKTGHAESIAFPKTAEEAAEILRYCNDLAMPVTVQGSRTGVGGGAVPLGGMIMNLEKMKGLKSGKDGETVIAGAAVPLEEISRFVRRQSGDSLFLPPDPTETTASAGGVVCCNSSGARTFGYGAMRNFVRRITVVTADGKILDIERGRFFAKGRRFDVSLPAKNGAPFCLELTLPSYNVPAVKNAAGYWIREDMDLIDLFIGAEGTLGVITEAEFDLAEKPPMIWGLIAFFGEEDQGVAFSESLKNTPGHGCISIEYFDRGSLDLLQDKQREMKGTLSWHVPEGFSEAVFLEVTAASKEEMLQRIGRIETEIRRAGGDPDDAWIAGSSRSFQSFKELRHATPESVNARIAENKKSHPGITKLGSDMSVPEGRLPETLKMYREDLRNAGLVFVIFGHIGNSHLHVNVISRNEEEYARGKQIYAGWAKAVSEMGGSVSAEHGVGKLKREFLQIMYGENGVREMRELKKVLDPKGILGRDNIFLWK